METGWLTHPVGCNPGEPLVVSCPGRRSDNLSDAGMVLHDTRRAGIMDGIVLKEPAMTVPSLSDLQSKKCVPCEGGVPKLTPAEAEALCRTVSGWAVVHNGERIRKEWVVKNFLAGMAFFEKVAEVAEAEGHHPDLHLVGYRNVAIEIWTHAIGGLSENDFILAAKIDELPIKLKSATTVAGVDPSTIA